jgi:hypothetical protein
MSRRRYCGVQLQLLHTDWHQSLVAFAAIATKPWYHWRGTGQALCHATFLDVNYTLSLCYRTVSQYHRQTLLKQTAIVDLDDMEGCSSMSVSQIWTDLAKLDVAFDWKQSPSQGVSFLPSPSTL